MFFPKLRRNAKWVFLFLALAFGLGFVGFGVGAGGVGIGDVFRGGGDSGIPSASEARERVAENPRDAQAHRDLATALQAEQETEEAIEALEQYVALKPRDTSALRELAALYLVLVSEAQQRYQEADLRYRYLAASANVLQQINLGGRPLEADAISNAVSSTIEQELQAALSEASQAASNAVAAYKKIAAVSPRDPTVQLELGEAARNAGDTATAIAAYKKYLTLVPADDPTRQDVKRILKELQPQGGASR